MKLIITKEQLEEQCGFKIQDFKLEPLYDGTTCIGLSVSIIQVQPVEEITISFVCGNKFE